MGQGKKVKKMAEKKVEKESLTAEALQSKLENLKKDQMNQRFQHAAGQMPKRMLCVRPVVKSHV